METGERNTFPKNAGSDYAIALGSVRTSLVAGHPERVVIAVGTTSKDAPVVSIVFFFDAYGVPIREPLSLESPIHQIECASTGIAVVVCGAHRKAVGVTLDRYVIKPPSRTGSYS